MALVNQAVAKLPHIPPHRLVVTKLQKLDRLTVFKLTGPNVINEQFITQLRTIGTKVGMRIQVMNTVQKRPIRPGKRIHHSSWNIATLNINSLNSLNSLNFLHYHAFLLFLTLYPSFLSS